MKANILDAGLASAKEKRGSKPADIWQYLETFLIITMGVRKHALGIE